MSSNLHAHSWLSYLLPVSVPPQPAAIGHSLFSMCNLLKILCRPESVCTVAGVLMHAFEMSSGGWAPVREAVGQLIW